VVFGGKWYADRRAERRRAAKELKLSTGPQRASAYGHLELHLTLEARDDSIYLTGTIANTGDRDVAGATYEVDCSVNGSYRLQLGAWPAGSEGPVDHHLFDATTAGFVRCEGALTGLDMGR